MHVLLRLVLLSLTLLAVLILREERFSQKAIHAPFLTETTSPSEPVTTLFSQSYRYLGEGKQSFAFVSEDGKWVIKFFKRKYFHVPCILQYFSAQVAKRQERLRFYRESYILAAQELAVETAIVYLHLGPSKDLPTLKLHNQLGFLQEINLNHIPFIVQKRCLPFYPFLFSSFAKQGITDFFHLIAKRIEKHIADKDHEIEGNFGVCDGHIIQLDPGRLCVDEGLNRKKRRDQEWWSATHRLRKWLVENRSELVDFFDSTLQTCIACKSSGPEED